MQMDGGSEGWLRVWMQCKEFFGFKWQVPERLTEFARKCENNEENVGVATKEMLPEAYISGKNYICFLKDTTVHVQMVHFEITVYWFSKVKCFTKSDFNWSETHFLNYFVQNITTWWLNIMSRRDVKDWFMTSLKV